MTLKRLLISILFTIFVLPGGGHFYLKFKKRALFFLVPVLLLMFAFVSQLQSIVGAQVNQVQDLNNIMVEAQNISQNIMADNATTFTSYIAALLFLYVASLGDLFWLYLKVRREASLRNPT